MQATLYNKFIEKLFKGEVDLDTATIKVALVNDPVNSGYSDISLQEDAANLAAFTGGSGAATGFNAGSGGHEFDGMSYARGTLAAQTVTRDTGTNQVIFTGTNQTFASLDNNGNGYGVGGVLVILHIDGTEANDVPIALLPFEKTPSGADVVVKWPSTGLLFGKQAA